MGTKPVIDSWIVFPRPNPEARLRLFCLPYAGGGASVFRSWPEYLPSSVELCSIQPPGRESRIRETPFRTMVRLVEETLQALLPYLDTPFTFFGHSYGALVMFELARRLREQYDLSPLHMFLSGCPAPQRPHSHTPIHSLPDSEFIDELRRYNGTPREVLEHDELMNLMIPLLKADFAVLETYVFLPGPPFSCPISVFGGLQDPKVSRDDLEAWREHTQSTFSLRMFPGDHFYFNTCKQLLLEMMIRELHVYVNPIHTPR